MQDEGSQLAGLLLARAPLEGPDEAWLDMCAGPGGKAGLLAAVRPEGVRLTAADRAPHRAELVRKALGGETDVEVLAADGREAPWAAGLLRPRAARRAVHGAGGAAPPSGGALAPDEEDVAPLVELQLELLAGALASVRPGGVVAYVTCSPHTEETVGVVDVARARDDVEVLPVAPLFPEVPDLARGDYGQLWPHRHGTDAMFMALLRRVR